jgi:hypothetical protein
MGHPPPTTTAITEPTTTTHHGQQPRCAHATTMRHRTAHDGARQ